MLGQAFVLCHSSCLGPQGQWSLCSWALLSVLLRDYSTHPNFLGEKITHVVINLLGAGSVLGQCWPRVGQGGRPVHLRASDRAHPLWHSSVPAVTYAQLLTLALPVHRW